MLRLLALKYNLVLIDFRLNISIVFLYFNLLFISVTISLLIGPTSLLILRSVPHKSLVRIIFLILIEIVPIPLIYHKQIPTPFFDISLSVKHKPVDLPPREPLPIHPFYVFYRVPDFLEFKLVVVMLRALWHY